MKKYLLAFVLCSVSSFACPNLTGTYLCESTDENGNVTQEEQSISQKVENGVTVYSDSYGENEMLADGKTHKSEDGSEYIATCKSNKSLNIKMKAEDSGMVFTADLNLAASADALVQTGSIKIVADGSVFEDTIDQTCKRLK